MTAPSTPALPPVDLLVLAGGRGTRLGGQDKAALVLGGSTLLDRLLAVVGPGAPEALGGRVVVVGDTAVPAGVLRTVEDPPDGGPVAGVRAGLDLLDTLDPLDAPDHERATGSGWVAVVAVDQPEAGEVVPVLRRQLAVAPGSVDGLRAWRPEFRDQWLLACYRKDSLRRALAALPEVHGASVRQLVTDLSWMLVVQPGELLGDVDTWEDVRAWQERLG